MIRITLYEPDGKSLWDEFIAKSKNGLFLFRRDYMDYHSDKFDDYSLMFFDDERLMALMPANIQDNMLVSHGGLTFGGIISDSRMKTPKMLEVFDTLKAYLSANGIVKIIYKAIPYIYHSLPADEDLYALYRNNAQLIRRDVSSSIYIKEKVALNKGRKWALKQSTNYNLEVKRSYDFKTFMAIEEHVLDIKYNLKPVHTTEELNLLASRFPENIKLFAAYKNGEMLAGVIIYESQNVAHAQYIAANDEGKKIGALDSVLDFLISDCYRDKKYFDFGISTEQDGRYLNIGLIENKESFGARAIAHDFYGISLS